MEFSTLADFRPSLDEEFIIYFWSDGRGCAEAAASELEIDGHAVTVVDISLQSLQKALPLDGFVFVKPIMGDASTPFIALVRQEWDAAPTTARHDIAVGKHYSVVKLWRKATDTGKTEGSQAKYLYDIVAPAA